MCHRSTSQAHQYFGVFAAVVIVVLGISACTTRPRVVPQTLAPEVATPPPTASVSVLAGQPTSSATVTASGPNAKAAIADWEEMFRVTQSYEYVKANGRPDDRAWWVEQAQRFYMSRARAEFLQQIELAFRPDVPATLGFIEKARYTVQVQACSSDTDCVLQVSIQSGVYWAYDVRQKSWHEANLIEPRVWQVPMRYDPDSGRWKIVK